jgi:hypothetical protein
MGKQTKMLLLMTSENGDYLINGEHLKQGVRQEIKSLNTHILNPMHIKINSRLRKKLHTIFAQACSNQHKQYRFFCKTFTLWSQGHFALCKISIISERYCSIFKRASRVGPAVIEIDSERP